MNKKQTIIILLSIITISLIFYIATVLKSESFWFDEVISLKIAEKPIIASWQYLKWENNPPLHYWYLHLWIKFFGSGEHALRFSSVLTNILSIIAIYILGKKISNKKTGLFAAFLISISCFQLTLATEARMYSLLTLFSILSLLFYWEILNQPKDKKYNLTWILYSISTLAAYYTHLTALFLPIIQNIFFFYHARTEKINRKSNKIKYWLFTQMTIILLFAPWLITFAQKTLTKLNSEAWYLHTQGSGFFFAQIPKAFLFLGDKLPLIELIGLIIFGCIFLASIIKIKKTSFPDREINIKLITKPKIIFLILIFIIPLILCFPIHLWVIKYYSISAIGFYILLAIGFNNLNLKKHYRNILIIVIFAMLLPYNISKLKHDNQHQWHQVAAYTQSIENKNDGILISAFVYEIIFNHYYQGDLNLIPTYPQSIASDDILTRSIKYNWYPLKTKSDELSWQQQSEKYSRVIIVYPTKTSVIHQSNSFLNWLMDNNWKLIHQKKFNGLIEPQILVFKNPNIN